MADIKDLIAFATLMRCAKGTITEKTDEELKALGIEMPASVERIAEHRIEENAVVICAELTDPLLMPGNKTGPCAWGCGRILQYRPEWPVKVQFVCCHCGADRLSKKDN